MKPRQHKVRPKSASGGGIEKIESARTVVHKKCKKEERHQILDELAVRAIYLCE